MSADNYWYVAPHPDGDGWTYVMGSGSDHMPPRVLGRKNLRWFATSEEALAAALNDGYTEYGVSCHPLFDGSDSTDSILEELWCSFMSIENPWDADQADLRDVTLTAMRVVDHWLHLQGTELHWNGSSWYRHPEGQVHP